MLTTLVNNCINVIRYFLNVCTIIVESQLINEWTVLIMATFLFRICSTGMIVAQTPSHIRKIIDFVTIITYVIKISAIHICEFLNITIN